MLMLSTSEAPLRATSSKSQPPHLVLDSQNNCHYNQNLSFDHLLSRCNRRLLRNPQRSQPGQLGTEKAEMGPEQPNRFLNLKLAHGYGFTSNTVPQPAPHLAVEVPPQNVVP